MVLVALLADQCQYLRTVEKMEVRHPMMNQAEAPGGTAHVPTWRMLFVIFVLQLLMVALFLAGVLAGKGR